MRADSPLKIILDKDIIRGESSVNTQLDKDVMISRKVTLHLSLVELSTTESRMSLFIT